MLMKDKRRCRIVYIIGSLSTGGAERQLLELLRRLDRSWIEPYLVLFTGETAERAEGLVNDVFSLDIPPQPAHWRSKIIVGAQAAFRLYRYLSRIQPDIVHAILPVSCILGCPAARLAGVPGIIGSRRSMIDSYARADKLVAKADRFAMRLADYALGNSLAVTREMVEVDGVPARRALTIYNGVDTHRFHPERDRSLRMEMGWTEEDVVFGIIANFIHYKRHIDFVRAAAIIEKRFPNAKFLMGGEDRGELREVRAEIERLGVGNIRIVEGVRSPETLFAAMDVYICTSQTEGLSNVLLEAMASGKPIIATRVGGNPELIVEGQTGFLAPYGAPRDIAEAAMALLRDRSLLKRMGEKARLHAEQSFSIEAMTERYHDLYRKLLREKSGELHSLIGPAPRNSPQGDLRSATDNIECVN